MPSISRLLQAVQHGPSAGMALRMEQAYACTIAAALGIILTAAALLGVPLHRYEVHMVIISNGLGLMAVLLMCTDRLPSTRAAAAILKQECGQEHLSLWMSIWRVFVLAAIYLVASVFHQEIFRYVVGESMLSILTCIVVAALAIYSLPRPTKGIDYRLSH